MQSIHQYPQMPDFPHTKVLVVGEARKRAILPKTLELAGAVSKFPKNIKAAALGVVSGEIDDPAVQEWHTQLGTDLLIIEGPAFEFPNPVLGVSVLLQVCWATQPEYVIFPHTMRHCQIAGMLARQLQIPCVTGVESIDWREDGGLTLERRLHEGRVRAVITTQKSRMILTAYSMPVDATFENISSGHPAVYRWNIRADIPDFTPVSVSVGEESDQSLIDAKVVVAFGRGLGSSDHLPLLNEFARKFKKSAVGGTRIACDMGWLPHHLQIGETGRKVNPNLYVACGISGSPQHLSGMRDSGMIVAINQDPGAEIFRVADIGVEANLHEFLPIFLELLNS